MDKLPEHLRPPVKELSDRVSKTIPSKLERFFVLDLQNDCACKIESYDMDNTHGLCHTDANGVPVVNAQNFGGHCHLPMFQDLNLNHIEDTIRQGLYLTTNNKPCCDLNMNGDITIHNRMWLTPISVLIDKSLHQEGLYKNAYAMELPEDLKDSVFVLPEPEFLGVIGANLFGMGFFFLSKHVMRVPITNEIEKLWTRYY